MKKKSLLIGLLALGVCLRFGPAQVPLGSTVVHWYLDAPVQQVSEQIYQLPEAPNQVMIFRNGMRLKDCARATAACDYSVAGSQIQFTETGAPVDGDVVIFDYIR